MRPVSSSTLTWLRAAITTAESTTPLTTRHRALPCLNSYTHSRRHQSTKPHPPPQDEPLQSHTHYHFFPQALPQGPPPRGNFSVDIPSLRKEFLQLQAKAHPDLHPPSRKTQAQALSARINEAYKTLSSPLLRAQYLLSLRGIDLASDSETGTIEDPELLMEVLEVRERIEEAEAEEELEGLKRENEGRIAESVRVLEEAFEGEDLPRAREEAVRLRYWVNLREGLEGWERGKGVVLEH